MQSNIIFKIVQLIVFIKETYILIFCCSLRACSGVLNIIQSVVWPQIWTGSFPTLDLETSCSFGLSSCGPYQFCFHICYLFVWTVLHELPELPFDEYHYTSIMSFKKSTGSGFRSHFFLSDQIILLHLAYSKPRSSNSSVYSPLPPGPQGLILLLSSREREQNITCVLTLFSFIQ